MTGNYFLTSNCVILYSLFQGEMVMYSVPVVFTGVQPTLVLIYQL